jgi:phosphatidate cytidylyltransferase
VADGEGRDDREDLFEDLDKFFAPIQDVDWPEGPAQGTPTSAAPPPAEPAPQPPPEEPAREPTPPEYASAPTPEETEVSEEEVVVSGQPEEPAGQLAEEATAVEATAVEATPAWYAGEEEGEEGGVEAFLFAEEEGAEVEIGEAITSERLSAAPDAYVDLPHTGEEGGAAIDAELVSAEGSEEAPSSEDLEAAAEHFAESVREEVLIGSEPEAETPQYDTEPGAEPGIEELLGPEEPEEALIGAEEGVPVRTVRVGTEGLGGPSWQEPTTVEVGPDQEGRGAGRNMQLAVITGLGLAAIGVIAIAVSTALFAVLAGLVVLIGQGEFYFALQKRHYQPATALGLVTGALVLGAGYYSGEAAMLAMTVLGTFAAFLWFMTVPELHRRNVASNIGLTVLGIVWVPLFAGYILIALSLPESRGLVLAILGLTVAYDASAFAVGYFWGSRPLAATISPKKSWEGAIGATLVVIALAVGVVAPTVGLLDTIPRAVGLAVVVAIFAPLGDLAESLLKRDLQIKDMGSILPGHGGILDRIDGMLFVAPAAFLFLRLVFS